MPSMLHRRRRRYPAPPVPCFLDSPSLGQEKASGRRKFWWTGLMRYPSQRICSCWVGSTRSSAFSDGASSLLPLQTPPKRSQQVRVATRAADCATCEGAQNSLPAVDLDLIGHLCMAGGSPLLLSPIVSSAVLAWCPPCVLKILSPHHAGFSCPEPHDFARASKIERLG